MFFMSMPVNFKGRMEDQTTANQMTDKKKQKYGLFVDDFVYVWSVGFVGASVRAFAALNAGSKWA